MCAGFDDLEICRGILESLPTGVCVVDMQKRIVFWSDGAERITGHLRHEVIGHSCIAEPLLHCDQPGCEFCNEQCAAARAIKSSHPAEAVGFLRHKAGHEVPVRVQAVPVHNQHGSVIGAVETFEPMQSFAVDRDSGRQSSAALDGVTGIGSHAMTDLYLRQAVAHWTESGFPFGLLMLQVEGLQRFRASHGPEAAACLLRAIARTLEGVLSINDFVGRWQDDLFLIILTNCREESLHAVREHVRHTLAGKSIEWWGERHSLPVSIGEAEARPDDTAETALGRARSSLTASSGWRGIAASAGSSGS